jgi:hypothetical protein
VPSLRLLRRLPGATSVGVRGGADVSIDLLSGRNRKTYHFVSRLATPLQAEAHSTWIT